MQQNRDTQKTAFSSENGQGQYQSTEENHQAKIKNVEVDLEETVQKANLALAKKHLANNSILDWKKDPQNGARYSLCVKSSLLGQYGIGLEMYFDMVKKLAILFFIISGLEIYQIWMN